MKKLFDDYEMEPLCKAKRGMRIVPFPRFFSASSENVHFERGLEFEANNKPSGDVVCEYIQASSQHCVEAGYNVMRYYINAYMDHKYSEAPNRKLMEALLDEIIFVLEECKEDLQEYYEVILEHLGVFSESKDINAELMWLEIIDLAAAGNPYAQSALDSVLAN